MITMEERLGDLFSNTEFLEKNANKESFEEIYEAVVTEIPEVTREELESCLVKISKAMDGEEVSEEALDEVTGGVSFLGACAAIAGAGTALSFLYKGGKAIGQGIYYMTHR